jgi:hypothetical protein
MLARVCLVPAARPADALAVTDWFCTDQFQATPRGLNGSHVRVRALGAPRPHEVSCIREYASSSDLSSE